MVIRSGARIKRFVMSRKMTSLPHLHSGVASFIQSRKKNKGKCIKDTLSAAVTDCYSVMDIFEDKSWMYSGKTLGINDLRLFIQSTFFKGEAFLSFFPSQACILIFHVVHLLR